MRAQPLEGRIDLLLLWEGEPPAPPDASTAAGFALAQAMVELLRGAPATPNAQP